MGTGVGWRWGQVDRATPRSGAVGAGGSWRGARGGGGKVDRGRPGSGALGGGGSWRGAGGGGARGGSAGGLAGLFEGEAPVQDLGGVLGAGARARWRAAEDDADQGA